jgi:hypothetical protein
MLVIYIFRTSVFYITGKKQKDIERWGYTIGHISMQSIISYIIGWVVIVLTFSENYNIFINYIIAPFVGTMSGIYLDRKFLIPLGNEYEKRKSSKSESSPNDSHNITINIDNSEGQNGENTGDSTSAEMVNALDKSIIDSEEFETVLVETINNIIESQNYQSNSLKTVKESIDAISNTEIINKKVELKSMIYKCLNCGFATPEENDKITQFYLAYTGLGGNHEIQTLYEQHYLKLSVHEDRRKMKDNQYNIYVNNSDYSGPDRREEKQLCRYKEFDNEYVESE